MANGLKGFTAAARGLSRNPLGIIALFIVLICGFACLVTGFAADFKETERFPLVWFLALFPLAVLGVFGWLVAKHHKKLYGPQDYKREEIFLETVGHKAQQLPIAASQEKTDDVDDNKSKLKLKREGITETAEDKYFGVEEAMEGGPLEEESPFERVDDAIDAEVDNLYLTTPEGRNIERNNIYKRNRNLFLSSVLVPPQRTGQTYDIFIFLVCHNKQDFSDVTKTEFFFRQILAK